MHEKVLNITNHQGNENQRHNEISPYTSYNGYYQKEKINVGEDVVEREFWDRTEICGSHGGLWDRVENCGTKLRIGGDKGNSGIKQRTVGEIKNYGEKQRIVGKIENCGTE